MSEGKMKFIEDAALVIDGRVAALKAELERNRREKPSAIAPGDRSAILEAEFCARLIRTLALAPYRGDPFEVASRRWRNGFEGRDPKSPDEEPKATPSAQQVDQPA